LANLLSRALPRWSQRANAVSRKTGRLRRRVDAVLGVIFFIELGADKIESELRNGRAF